GDASEADSASGRRSTACRPELANSRKPYCRDSLRSGGKGPMLAVLPPGKFMMGGEKPDEQPVHEVRIDYPYAMAVNEVSVGEYMAFCKATGRSCPPQPWNGSDYPVVNVTWEDAVAYTE